VLSEKPWRAEAVFRLLLCLCGSLAAGGLSLQLLGPGGAAATPAWRFVSLAIGVVCFHGVGLLLVALFLREHEVSWSQAFGFESPGLGRALGLACFATTLALPIAWGLGQLSAMVMRWCHLDPEMQQAIQALQGAESWPERLMFALLAVVAAPVAEEVLFRGILYPFIKQAGFARLSLWGTAMLFAATHANLMTFLPLTFLALLLTLLYEKTDNLAAPIVAHALFNLANFVWIMNEPRLMRWFG
jgi:membrane protease YdiL (CAAX protease family)